MDQPPEEMLKLAIPIVAIGGGLLVSIIWVVVDGVRRMLQTRAREASRREVAAYVAEGSMSPDDAVRILNAGRTPKETAAAASGGRA